MKFDEINDENVVVYAATNYYNPKCSDVEDFYEDLNRLKYIKRLINRYHESNEIPTRLLLNHLIIFTNTFTIKASVRIFKHKYNPKIWTVLKPFLIHLGYIKSSEFPDVVSDPQIEKALERI